jgi:hypothetical protein
MECTGRCTKLMTFVNVYATARRAPSASSAADMRSMNSEASITPGRGQQSYSAAAVYISVVVIHTNDKQRDTTSTSTS